MKSFASTHAIEIPQAILEQSLEERTSLFLQLNAKLRTAVFILLPGGTLLTKTAAAFNTPPVFTSAAERGGPVKAIKLPTVQARRFEWGVSVLQQIGMLCSVSPSLSPSMRGLVFKIAFSLTFAMPLSNMIFGLVKDFQALLIGSALQMSPPASAGTANTAKRSASPLFAWRKPTRSKTPQQEQEGWEAERIEERDTAESITKQAVSAAVVSVLDQIKVYVPEPPEGVARIAPSAAALQEICSPLKLEVITTLARLNGKAG
jgi:hypothetical protein